MIDNDGKSGGDSSVYGTIRVNSMLNSTHIWRFQSSGPKLSYCLNFGIDATKIE